MKRAALLISFLLTLGAIHAQKVSGVWFAGCNLKIDKYAGVDEYKVDSIYGVEGSIIDFISKDKFIIKAIGEEERQGVYSQSGDTLKLSIDEFNWKGVIKDKEFTLSLIDSADYGLELFYKKLTSSNIPKNRMLDENKLIRSNWKATYDWGYSMLSFQQRDSIDLIDKPKAFISNFSKIRTVTEIGNYQIDSYKNHLFLYLLGRETLSEKVIHISEFNSGKYKGILFDCVEPISSPIPIEKVEFIQIDKLSEDDFENERLDLIGRYQLQLLDVKDLGLSDSVKTVISYFELHNDGSCSIEAYVTENIDGVAVLRKLEKSGQWIVAPSGHFVSVIFDEGNECYFTLKKEDTKKYLFLDSNPWPEEPELNTVLKFKKQ